MTLNTGGNNAEHNSETGETGTPDSGNVLTQFYKEFSDSIVKDLTPEKTNEEIEKFMQIDSLSGDNLKYVSEYMGRYDQFKSLKLSDIKLGSIKNKLRKEFLTRKSLFHSMKTSILKDYNITPAQYSDLNVEKGIKTLELSKISEHIKSPRKLEKFISDFCEDKFIDVFEKKGTQSLFDNLSISDRFMKKLDNFTEEEKNKLVSQMYNFKKSDQKSQSFAGNCASYIKTLLEKGLLEYTEISELFKIYVPYISLKTAIEINSNLEENEIIKQQLLSLDGSNFSLFEKEEQDKIINNIDSADIFLPIEFLFTLPNNAGIHVDSIKKIIDTDIFKNIACDIQNAFNKTENKEGNQSHEDFIDGLKEKEKNKQVINPEQCKNGNYIIITEKSSENSNSDGEQEEKKVFYQIVSDGKDTPQGCITIASMGTGKYSSDNSKNTSISYDDWNKYLENGNPEKGLEVDLCEFYTEKSFKDKIKTGEISEDEDSTIFKTELDLDGKKVQEENEKIKEYLEEYPEFTEFDDDVLREKMYEEYPDFKNELEEKYDNWNTKYLIIKLRELDDAGDKYGFEQGTTIEYIDSSKNTQYFTVENTNDLEISISHNNRPVEKLEYGDFYEAFKSQNAKRINKTKNGKELLENIGNNESIKDYWKGITISDSGSLVKKNDSEESDEELEYEYIEGEGKFVDDCDVIKIHEIKDGFAKISFGKKTGHEKLDDKKAQKEKEEKEKKEGKKINYNMYSNTETIPVGVLQAYIDQAAGIPKSFTEENSPEVNEDPESVKREGSLMSRFLQRLSINDLLAGGKLLADSIESKLKEGTEEQAAKMLSNLWLPDSVRVDVTMRVEQASKKRMDEFKDRLGGMDSGIATDMIEKVLLNKDSPESMKEACIMFMAEKYGTLYEKKALHKYKGKYLRYEAFGGRIGDELYRETEKDCKKDCVNFTEHELMIGLLGKQCKGRLQPKRRSKLHKEYKAAMGRGKTDEQEKGKKDAGEKRTFNGRLYGVALDELKDGAYLNAIGAMGPVISKGDGGNPKGINMMPFVMMASGDAYTYDQDISNTIKGTFSPAGMPMPSTFFCSSPTLIDLYNQTLVRATQILAGDNPSKYGDMLSKVTSLISGNKNVTGKKTEKAAKIDEAIKVYEKYGDEICRIMNMLNTRSNDNISKYEKLIFLEKDNDPIFSEYYKLFSEVAVGAECEFGKDDDTMVDAFHSGEPGTGGYTGMGSKKVFRDTLAEHTGGTYRLTKAGPQTEGELVKQLYAFQKVDYNYGSADENTANERKLNAVTDYIHGYFYAMKYHHNKDSAFKEVCKKTPMKMLKVIDTDFSSFTAKDFEDDKESALALSRKYAEKWLGMGSQNENNDSSHSIPGAIDETRSATNDTLNNNNNNNNNN